MSDGVLHPGLAEEHHNPYMYEKKEGTPADSANYLPIHLLCHSMKVFKRITDHRISDIIRVSTNQCGFVGNCRTTESIHAARMLVEKHREK
ncbi:hypothetical protein Y032_0011g1558 [Ancylostoma ceylanicum]|uniref:Reverse transcriptase domain-containing protein n=1 Tax=Ancylostoma ceylanicum TaxID=53326 RepID=A0A016VFP6_9BILA|nr:hypothetical protein Y032_0011g1558 [Ancylostoma ceylanicum]